MTFYSENASALVMKLLLSRENLGSTLPNKVFYAKECPFLERGILNLGILMSISIQWMDANTQAGLNCSPQDSFLVYFSFVRAQDYRHFRESLLWLGERKEASS